MRRKGRRPHLKPVIGSGLKTDTDVLTSCQSGSHKASLHPVRVPACLSSPGQKNKHGTEKCFFLAYTSVPEHAAHKLTSKRTGGKRPVWGLPVTYWRKKERGLGFTCAEETGVCPAVYLSYFAKLKEPQLRGMNVYLKPHIPRCTFPHFKHMLIPAVGNFFFLYHIY